MLNNWWGANKMGEKRKYDFTKQINSFFKQAKYYDLWMRYGKKKADQIFEELEKNKIKMGWYKDAESFRDSRHS